MVYFMIIVLNLLKHLQNEIVFVLNIINMMIVFKFGLDVRTGIMYE